jgi:hypothetical protein
MQRVRPTCNSRTRTSLDKIKELQKLYTVHERPNFAPCSATGMHLQPTSEAVYFKLGT